MIITLSLSVIVRRCCWAGLYGISLRMWMTFLLMKWESWAHNMALQSSATLALIIRREGNDVIWILRHVTGSRKLSVVNKESGQIIWICRLRQSTYCGPESILSLCVTSEHCSVLFIQYQGWTYACLVLSWHSLCSCIQLYKIINGNLTKDMWK